MNTRSVFICESPRPHFGGSTVIDHFRIKPMLNSISNFRNRATGFSRNDDRSNAGLAQIQFLLFCQFDQMQRVAGRAKHDRRIDREN